MDAGIDSFVHTAVAWGGQSCDCPVSVAVSFGGSATATAPRVLPDVSTVSSTTTGRTGDASATAISMRGDASAVARNGTAGATGPPVVTAAANVTHSRTATGFDGVYRAARTLTDRVGAADAAARGLARGPGDPPLVHALVMSMDVATTGDDCNHRTCSLAMALSVGGAARAVLGAPPACGSGTGIATSVAVAFDGDARAGIIPDVRRSACSHGSATAGRVTATVGGSGAALGVSLAADGPATATVASGDLGAAGSRTAGAPSRTGVVATSGRSGDAGGMAVGTHAASVVATSGDTGDAVASCTGCAQAVDGITRAVSGDTGDTFSVSGSGRDATASAVSGGTGDVTATASGESTNSRTIAQKSYHGGTVTGRSGDTGDVFAGAIDPSAAVEVVTRSGLSGFVTSTTTGPYDRGDTSTGNPGSDHQEVNVGRSGEGTRSIRTGHHRETSTVSPHLDSARSITTRAEHSPAVTRSVPPSVTPQDFAAPAPTIVRLTPAGATSAPSAPQPADNDHRRSASPGGRGSTAATIGITSGAIVFSLAALLVALVRLRRGRSRR